jgi:hypothetical protein
MDLVYNISLKGGKEEKRKKLTISKGSNQFESLWIFSWIVFIFLSISFFLLLCWGYIVAFTKVLTIYQKCHSWIQFLLHSPLSPLTHSWNSFNRSHFSIYIHVYTVFALFSSLVEYLAILTVHVQQKYLLIFGSCVCPYYMLVIKYYLLNTFLNEWTPSVQMSNRKCK